MPCTVASSTGHMAPKATTANTMPEPDITAAKLAVDRGADDLAGDVAGRGGGFTGNSAPFAFPGGDGHVRAQRRAVGQHANAAAPVPDGASLGCETDRGIGRHDTFQ